MNTINNETTSDLFVMMAVEAWNVQIKRFNKFLESMDAEQISKEIAPGKNTGTYLLGHLVAVTDGMLPLFGLQDKMYPQLQEPFIVQPDKSGFAFPSFEELKAYWNNVTSTLDGHIKNMDSKAWFERHTSVSEEDFVKEPHRNKLNVLLSRTNHQSYHFGQMILLQVKS
jgi:uncharacterized damage-inducible protein DinB